MPAPTRRSPADSMAASPAPAACFGKRLAFPCAERPDRRPHMNPELLTQRSREALAAAVELAAARRHPQVEPAHLGLALLEPQDGYVAAVLQHVGSRRADVLADLEGLLKSLPRVSGAQPAPSARLLAVLDEAAKLAKKRG